MKLLIQYLSRYKALILLALVLAAINQIFSLLNPYILGNYLIDPYANKAGYFRERGMSDEFFKGILVGLLLIIGTAMVSRIAKAFQDYVVNVVIQKFGANLYTDGLRHALRLPFQDFEDQRSGETLSVLQKVRADCEKFITSFVNVLFATLVGIGRGLQAQSHVTTHLSCGFRGTGISYQHTKQEDKSNSEKHCKGDNRAGWFNNRVFAKY
jgi:ATP-binding cassette subfamily B protein